MTAGAPVREVELLLVDDDEADVAIALLALARAGLAERAVIARDGQEALEYLSHTAVSPRLILLDLRMPRVGGLELLRRIRADARLRQTPVVMLSSSSLEADVDASYREGANSFVRKRFEPGEPGRYVADIARYWLDLNETHDPWRGAER
jgi:two-component system response regulator